MHPRQWAKRAWAESAIRGTLVMELTGGDSAAQASAEMALEMWVL